MFYIFADDALPKYVTATAILDYDTVAVADKFGNVSVMRLPGDISKRIEADPSGGKAYQGSSWLNGAPNKLETSEWVCVTGRVKGHVAQHRLSCVVALSSHALSLSRTRSGVVPRR